VGEYRLVARWSNPRFQVHRSNRSDPIYLLDVASEQILEVPGSQTGEGINPALILVSGWFGDHRLSAR
jgi:hypothetical protein